LRLELELVDRQPEGLGDAQEGAATHSPAALDPPQGLDVDDRAPRQAVLSPAALFSE